MSQKKFKIELNETQLLSLINAADLQSRIESGQIDDLLYKGISMSKKVDRDKARALIDNLKMVLFPELDYNEIYSISSPNLSENAKLLYDLHQVMRYTYSWSVDPKGEKRNIWYSKAFKYAKEDLALVREIKND